MARCVEFRRFIEQVVLTDENSSVYRTLLKREYERDRQSTIASDFELKEKLERLKGDSESTRKLKELAKVNEETREDLERKIKALDQPLRTDITQEDIKAFLFNVSRRLWDLNSLAQCLSDAPAEVRAH